MQLCRQESISRKSLHRVRIYIDTPFVLPEPLLSQCNLKFEANFDFSTHSTCAEQQQ